MNFISRYSVLIIVFSALLLSQNIQAAGLEEAPMNPEFIDYLNNKDRVGIYSSDDEDFYGLTPTPVPSRSRTELQIMDEKRNKVMALPSQYDMRDPNNDGNQADSILPPIRDQLSCGSCWTFGTYGSLEAHIIKKFGIKEDFSEDHMKNLHGFDWGPCDGGNIFISMAYLSRFSGPVNESADPYEPYDSTSSSLNCPNCNPQRYVNDIVLMHSRTNSTDNDYIKQAVIDHGSLYVTYYHHDAYYNSGDYTYYYNGSSLNGNHAVAIVGWNNYKNVAGAPGPGAFLIRNSWGANFGDGGYFYISYYDKFIANESLAYVNEEEASQNEIDTVYDHDTLGWVTNAGTGSDTLKVRNDFYPPSDGVLMKVGFHTDYNTNYTIWAETEARGMQLVSSGHTDDAGYRTIALASPMAYNSGEKLSIYVEYNTPGYPYPVPVEKAIPGFSSNAVAHSGESYYWSGTSYVDIGNSGYNACVKALCQEGTGPVLDGITGQFLQNGNAPRGFVMCYQGGEPTRYSILAADGSFAIPDAADAPFYCISMGANQQAGSDQSGITGYYSLDGQVPTGFVKCYQEGQPARSSLFAADGSFAMPGADDSLFYCISLGK